MAEGQPKWDEVLAAVEADARRARELLITAPADLATPSHDWTQPAAALPSLAAMPPVPAELRHRIEDLRSRIDELQAELLAALGNRHVPARASFAGHADGQPIYVDRLV